MRSLISKNNFILGGIILLVIIVSFQTLTTKPGLWVDEAKTILLARSYANYGTLDIEVSPGRYSKVKPLLQSTGYPTSIPLAFLFRIFGESFELARVYMLAWMCIALIGIYFFSLQFGDKKQALFSVALVASFASFHDSGRTVVGEIPGFIFLLAGLYYWIKRGEYIGAGFFLSLALVTKPSVYLSVVPAIILVVLFEDGLLREKFVRLARVFLGSLPPVLFWITFSIDRASQSGTFNQVLHFLSNPYGSSSFHNIWLNVLAIPFSTTLIYFSLLGVVSVFAYRKTSDVPVRKLYVFFWIYLFFAFVYYLRSPGWLRYLLASELLLLIILPCASRVITKHWRLGVSLLVIFQIYHFFNLAQIQYSDATISLADEVNNNYIGERVGLVNAIEIASLLPYANIEQVIEMDGIPKMGINPLLSDPPPHIVITAKDISHFGGEDVLINKYKLILSDKGYSLYVAK
ncbi:MAG TPA: glycosyltransferase family 39 protein [Candidatus Paceibacterota bacterium]